MLLRLASACVLACFGVAGCDGGLTLENGRPRVTWVEVAPLEGGVAALTLWVADVEGEAVDVAIAWEGGGGSGELELAPGSAPLTGLPTELGLNTEEGQAHRVTWSLEGVPSGALTLTLTVDDRPRSGDEGDTYRVTGVDPRAGSGPTAATLIE